jgi:hypothetical protein
VSDLFCHDDAAYALGALDGAERADFEAHLIDCPECAARVREASALADLLAFVPADAYGCGDGSAARPAPARSRGAAVGLRRRWHRIGVGALAAACLVVLAVLVWPTGSGATHGPRRAMVPVAPVAAATSVRASAQLVDKPWGTAIDVNCDNEGAYTTKLDYTLLVVGRHGERYAAGSWRPVPGTATEFIGGTALPRGAIAAVQILADNRPVLVLNLH